MKAPRFSPDGKTLVWLERGDFGPHHTCMTLVKKDVPLNSSVAMSQQSQGFLEEKV